MSNCQVQVRRPRFWIIFRYLIWALKWAPEIMCFWAWLGLAICLRLAPGLVLGWLWDCSGLVWACSELLWAWFGLALDWLGGVSGDTLKEKPYV